MSDPRRTVAGAREGASAVEAALIVTLVALFALGAWTALGTSVSSEVQCSSDAIGSGRGAACAPGGRSDRSSHASEAAPSPPALADERPRPTTTPAPVEPPPAPAEPPPAPVEPPRSPLDELGSFFHGFVGGFVDGGATMVQSTIALGGAAIDGAGYALTHPGEVVTGVADAVTHPDRTLAAGVDMGGKLVEGLGTAIVHTGDTLLNGTWEERGRIFGGATFEVASSVVPVTKIASLAKLGTIAKLGHTAGVLDHGSDAARLAAGATDDVARAATLSPSAATLLPIAAVKRRATRLVGDDDLLARIADDLEPLPGYHDVLLHGERGAFSVFTRGRWVDLTHRDLANALRHDPNYVPGTPIRLVSCSTGQGGSPIAEHLANKLGVDVMAPDVVLFTGGNPIYGAERGAWQVFRPNSKGVATIDSSIDAMPGNVRIEPPVHERITIGSTDPDGVMPQRFTWTDDSVPPGRMPLAERPVFHGSEMSLGTPRTAHFQGVDFDFFTGASYAQSLDRLERLAERRARITHTPAVIRDLDVTADEIESVIIRDLLRVRRSDGLLPTGYETYTGRVTVLGESFGYHAFAHGNTGSITVSRWFPR